jgi:hypothetical protein
MLRRAFRSRFGRGSALLIALLGLLLASCTSVQGITPAKQPGDYSCAAVDAAYQSLTVNPVDATTPVPGYPGHSVTVTMDGLFWQDFTWSATLGIDAIIVYSAQAANGPMSNVYAYPGEDLGDSGLTGPAVTLSGPPPITNIEFCYDDNGSVANSITIVKDAVGPDAGTAQFDLIFTASGPVTTPFALGDGGERVFPDLAPGTYEIHEPGEAGWSLTGVACVGSGIQTYLIGPPTQPLYGVNIALAEGGHAVCTFTNTQQQEVPGLNIVKEATPADDTPFEFVCSLTGVPDAIVQDQFTATDFAPGCDFVLRDPSDNSKALPLLPMVITELVPDGWALDDIVCNAPPEFWHRDGNTLFLGSSAVPCPGGDCVIAIIQPTEPVTCTFYNSAYGHIVVRKVVAADAPAATFNFHSDWGADFSLGGNEATVAIAVPAGAHSVAEVGLPEGWSLASAFCDDGSDPSAIGVSAGETVTCYFNNRYEPEGGSLTFIKRTTPAGGTGFAFDGTLGAFSLDDGGMKTFEDLAAGPYTVTETPAAGWEFEDVTCFGAAGAVVDFTADGSSVTVNLAEGQDVTCKFANREEGTSGPEGSLTIIKHTVPAGGTGFAFEAGGLGTFSLDDGGSKTFTDLLAGVYTVEETPAADWEFASITCDALDYVVDGASVTVNLAEGEAAVCTFNNGELPYTGSSAWLPLLLGGVAVLLMGLGAWTFSWVKEADKA